MKLNIANRVGVAAFSALLAACSSTTIDRTWTAPDLTKIKFNKVLVIATLPEGAARRRAEDAMKAQISSTQAVTSYSVLGAESDVRDSNKVINAIKAQGIDGVIVMRGMSDRTDVSSLPSTPPMGYRSFGSYYSAGYALGGYYGETITSDRIITVETNIYEMPGGKLIWSGMTSSSSPGNIPQLVEDAAKAIRSEMARKNLIPTPAS